MNTTYLLFGGGVMVIIGLSMKHKSFVAVGLGLLWLGVSLL